MRAHSGDRIRCRGRRTRRQRDGQAGFTMIEVMIASLLMAIAMAGIIGLFMVQTRSAGFSRRNTEASILAEDKMESLRTQTAPFSGLESGLVEPGGSIAMFDRRWSVTPNASFIDYNVTVSWLEDGVPRSLTLISKRGL